MTTGTVTYTAPIIGLELNEFEVSISHPHVEKIILKTENSYLRIVFTLKDVFSSDNFESITCPIIDLLLNRLSFHCNKRVGEPYCSVYSLPNKSDGHKSVVALESATGEDIPKVRIKPGSIDLQNLRNCLESPFLPGEIHYPLFNFAASRKDPVARFMFLYNILLSLNSDKQ